nr:pre-rrna-processing protein esf1 [Quercus suber]
MADSRFDALSKDPRYRLPNRKEARTAVDPRFGRLFKDQDFRKKARVDRYGRKIKPEAGKKELEKLYRLDGDDEQQQKRKSTERLIGKSEDTEDDEEDEDDEDGVDVEDLSKAQKFSAKRDPARDGGFSESSSDESDASSADEDSEAELDLAEDTAGHEQTENIPMGDVTRRIAAVNLDWDNIRATDIMAVASSFAPKSGRITNVTIYPSEFGQERLQREELEGPPREIFASSNQTKQEDDEEDESGDSEEEDERIKSQLLRAQANGGEGEEFDTAKLRAYQLDRLRYYYAVIECESEPTAKALYDAMDGREYINTANFFDLRFIPDETSFDDDTPRDECWNLPENYKPNEFRTEALTHSKVRLTWDDDDVTRKEVQKRAFSRAEIDENDLQAYIGSDSSDADSVSSRKSVTTPAERKAKKKEAERLKMRSALGLGEDSKKSSSAKKKDEPVGDMQITFTSGLGGKEGKEIFENAPGGEETTRQKYVRKEKERAKARKARRKAERNGETVEIPETEEAAPPSTTDIGVEDEADPFNDPFFNDPAAAAAAEKKAKQAIKQQKHDARAARDAEAAERRAELELLMAGDKEDEVRHFDMREIEKAEKQARKKGKRGKKSGKVADEEGGAPDVESFKVQTEDPRFKALFESHEYAIDPTNPKFKSTEGMKALLEEGRKKRKHTTFDDAEGDDVSKKAKKHVSAEEGDENVKNLVARLKGKGGRR